MQLRTLGCLYPSNSRRDAFDQGRSSQIPGCSSQAQSLWSLRRLQSSRTPCFSSQEREGSLQIRPQIFTQYSPITLAPIAPTFLFLDDCKVDTRRRQSRSMPLPNITREESESGSIQTRHPLGNVTKLSPSVVVTSDDGQSTSIIFPSEIPGVENLQNSAKGKIQRQRSKSH